MEAKATLEQRVEERTRELQNQVAAKEKTLADLAEAQSSLVEMSRSAGMAEVATGVLHNVGNVLNSVNVSCSMLLNLTNNAKHAGINDGKKEKVITLQVGSDRPGNVRMQVADNGMGIAPENMTRIFQHGFTTRESGHGFGLHSSALAAHELGGNLSVRSDGSGLGATFTLLLPLHGGEIE